MMKREIEDFIRQYYSKNTKRTYSLVLNRFGEWCGWSIPQDAFWMSAWKKYLIELGLGNKTVNQGLIIVNQFHRYSTGREILYTRLKEEPTKIEFLNNNEITKLLTSKDIVGCGIIRFMLDSGVRLAELIEISERDITGDIPKEWVIIGKGSKQRMVMISDETIGFISNIRRGGLIFGTKLNARGVQRKLYRIGIEVGLKKRLHPHMLRHTSATVSLQTGANIVDVQRMLGHSNIGTTQIYTHVTDDRLRSVWERCFENRRMLGK